MAFDKICAYVSTGLPLSTAHRIYRDRDQFVQIAQNLINDEMSLNSIIEFSAWIENWARHNASAVVKNIASEAVMTEIREKWINARPMRDIIAESTSADSICKDVYGFQLPWLIHAASQQLRQMGHDNLCNTLSSIALLVELGVPSELSAWVFLAGVGSRVSATEIANCGVDLGDSYISVRQTIRNPHALSLIAKRVSEPTKILINQQIKNTQRTPIEPLSISEIWLSDETFGSYNTVVIRRLNGLIYVCSLDGKAKFPVGALDTPIYEKLADDYRFAFIRDDREHERYIMTIRDPRLLDQYIENIT